MSNLAQFLAEKYHRVSNGELFVGGLPIRTLVERHGTPLFVYDSGVIDAKLAALRSALPSHFSVFYSLKANPNPSVVQHLVSCGCGLEVASAGEFSIALAANCDPQNILFAGPGKTMAELEFALSHNIGEIHVESLTEAKRIATICRRLGRRAPVAIRVNPAGEAEGGAMRMGGRSTPFGVDEEDLENVLKVISQEETLDLRGMHLFSGTQILDAKILLSQYRYGLELTRRVSKQIGRALLTLDLGGGLGIPYFAQDKEVDLTELRSGLHALMEGIRNDQTFKDTRFILEPGRYVVGEAGVYIARVNDVKISRGRKYLILDGGMNHHLAASGNLGQTIKRNYPVALVNKLGAPSEEEVDVVGPLCTPLDTLARSVKLPRAGIGDLFGIFQSGAYGYSASPLKFLSHREPVEVFMTNGHEPITRETAMGKTVFA
jgi:diaminopimelate decarboxylase